MKPRFRPSHRDVLLKAKAGNDFMADMAGKPRMDYGDSIPPVPKRRAKRTGKTPEGKVNDRITDWAHSRSDLRLYRNNRGLIDLPSGGKLAYGVGPNGASDFIGYRTVTITPEMVGRKVAIFTAIESKADSRNATPEQSAFIDVVLAEGGIAGVAHSSEDAAAIIDYPGKWEDVDV